jgi:pectate lyase
MKRQQVTASLIMAGAISVALTMGAGQPAHAADNTFTIVNHLTGKCLEASPYGDYHANGDLIIEETCNGQPEQRWATDGTGGAWFHLVNQRSSLCMDVQDGWRFDLGTVQQWECTSTRGMNWKATLVDPFSGGYAVVSQINDSTAMCLDDWYARNSAHGSTVTWHCSSKNDAQTFSFK